MTFQHLQYVGKQDNSQLDLLLALTLLSLTFHFLFRFYFSVLLYFSFSQLNLLFLPVLCRAFHSDCLFVIYLYIPIFHFFNTFLSFSISFFQPFSFSVSPFICKWAPPAVTSSLVGWMKRSVSTRADPFSINSSK